MAMLQTFTVRAIKPDGREFAMRWQVIARDQFAACAVVRRFPSHAAISLHHWELQACPAAEMPNPYTITIARSGGLHGWSVTRTSNGAVARMGGGHATATDASGAAFDALADLVTADQAEGQ